MTDRLQQPVDVELEALPSVSSAMTEAPRRQDLLSPPEQGASGGDEDDEDDDDDDGDVETSVPCTDEKSSQPVVTSQTKYDVWPPGYPRPTAPPDSHHHHHHHHPSSTIAHCPPCLMAASTPPSDIAPIIPSVSMAAAAAAAATAPAPAPSPMAPPVTTGPGVTNCAALLANVRAKLAATKKREAGSTIPSLAAAATAATTTTTTTLPPSHRSDAQVFELTHLKTIKCDVCEQKNRSVLYKCRNCPLHHQICSGCVETTEPKPAEGEAGGRRDWSVHAVLKDAHAAYNQPICPGRGDDGSYQRGGVRFVVAGGRRAGVRTAARRTTRTRTTTTTTGKTQATTSQERNSALRRAVAGHRSVEQARRIAEMADSGLKRCRRRSPSPSPSPSLRQSQSRREISHAVAAPRARHAGSKTGPVTQRLLGNRKRKATAPGEGRVDGDGDGGGDGDGNVADDDGYGDGEGDGDDEDEDEDEGQDDMDHDEEDGRDASETATALEKGLGSQSRQSSESDAKHRSEPPLAPWWQPNRVLPRFRAGDAEPRHASSAQYDPLSMRSNQASIRDTATRQDESTRSSGRPSSGPSPFGSTQQTGHPTPDRPHMSVMRITSPNTRPATDPNPRSLVGLLGPQRSRDPDMTSPTTTTSIFDSVHEGDRHRGRALTSRLPGLGPCPSHPPSRTADEETREEQTSFQAQRELQHTAGGDKDGGVGPYAGKEDAQGIAILLQAAKVAEDRNRRQELQNRRAQLDGSVEGDEPGTSGQASDDNGDSPGTFNNPSEPDWPNGGDRTPPLQGVARPTRSSRPDRSTIPEPGIHRHRRSERLAMLQPNNRPESQRRIGQRVKIKTKPRSHAAAVTSGERNGPGAIAPSPIQATAEKSTAGAGVAVAAPRQRSKPKWDPLITSFLAEQRRKRRKTMQWLAQQPSSEEEGYDKGVEGGFWIESEGESQINGSGGEDADMVNDTMKTNQGKG